MTINFSNETKTSNAIFNNHEENSARCLRNHKRNISYNPKKYLKLHKKNYRDDNPCVGMSVVQRYAYELCRKDPLLLSNECHQEDCRHILFDSTGDSFSPEARLKLYC